MTATLRALRTAHPAAAWICLAALFGGLAGCKSETPASGQPLHCYVGGTMRPAMEKLAKDYEAETGRKVVIDYAGSGELLIRIETQQTGDLYVCHDPFQDFLMRKGLGIQGHTVAVVAPTIVVGKGNPKQIKSVKDLAGPGLKLAMTDAEHSTTGWIIPTVFRKAGLQKEIEANIVKRTRGGGSAANLVAVGDVDAAIVWDAVQYARRDKIDAVPIDEAFRPIPGIDAVTSATDRTYDIGRIKVTIATLKCSKQPDAAKKFAEYVVAHSDVFVREFGFSPPPAAPAGGSLSIHCGAGIRHAMADAVRTFQQKTGAKLQVSYQGSGTLITTIKLKREGDLYMPGDVWYLDQLAKDGSVEARKLVAYFVPVIIVPKGNPKGIEALADLVKPSVKLGLGNPKACQIGRLSEQIFEKNKIDPAAVRERTAFSSVTVNELGVKVQTRSIDGAIVWDAVAANFAKDVDVVPIPAEQNLVSHVVIGMLAFSKNKPLARRFMDFLGGEEGKAIFAGHSYTVTEPK